MQKSAAALDRIPQMPWKTGRPEYRTCRGVPGYRDFFSPVSLQGSLDGVPSCHLPLEIFGKTHLVTGPIFGKHPLQNGKSMGYSVGPRAA